MRDHPRGCGAHFLIERKNSFGQGSSPRVRGSPGFTEDPTVASGIIPAGAGLTDKPKDVWKFKGDHPRGCGAHLPEFHGRGSRSGSSPRVRGSLGSLPRPCLLIGIIPAGAGLTHPDVQGGHRGRDHPRGCGAHRLRAYRRRRLPGSSPRVRGSLSMSFRMLFSLGIIPAGAGLTVCDGHFRLKIRDHPRGCGAHTRRSGKPSRRSGSSPRVRGSPLYLP